MTEQTKTRIPTPLYAAAGAGDLAYQQLRKLPAVLTELSDKATASLKSANEKATASLKSANEKATASLKSANEQATTRVGTLRDKASTADLDKWRDTAASSAAAFAQIAQERAVAIYTALVARGERVVGSGVIGAADVVNSDIVATEEPKAVEAAQALAQPKPRKRARPASE